jgi:hypothetical protein
MNPPCHADRPSGCELQEQTPADPGALDRQHQDMSATNRPDVHILTRAVPTAKTMLIVATAASQLFDVVAH